ncbi:MAG: acyltransferase [Candidatus Cryptobacteroides sp.]
MTEGWRGRSRGGKTGYRIFIYLLEKAGLGAAYSLLFFVALYYIPAAPHSTAEMWRYSRRILGYSPLKSILFIYRNYYAFGQSIIDKVAISSGMEDRFSFTFQGADPVFRAFREGQGAITIGAHFGNWAAGEPFFRKYGARLNLVMYDNESEDIKEVLDKNSEYGKSFKVIPVNKDNLAHIFMITEALDRGEVVSFLGDRYVNNEKLLKADLLGREVNFPSGPFLLASKMKVPVYFYFAVREGHRKYRFSFIRADIPERSKGVRPENEVLRQFAGALGSELSGHPEQWYNYYDFWGFREKTSKI